MTQNSKKISENAVIISKIDKSNKDYIDSILHGTKWGGGVGSTVKLTFSFAKSKDFFDEKNYSIDQKISFDGFSELTKDQKTAAEDALKAWEEVANIDFEPITETETETEKIVGNIRFVRANKVNNYDEKDKDGKPQDGTAKVADFPTPISDKDSKARAEAGDLWFSSTGNNATQANGYNNPFKGGYGYVTFIHELGHALGLKHPHDSGGSGVIAKADIDTTAYSVMSYRSYVNQPTEGVGSGYSQSFYPTTPMLNDIAAIQYLYGANMSTRTGNDNYNWNYFTGNGSRNQILQSIWDAGGIDTVDWSGQTSAAKINLNPGAWSKLGPAYYTKWNEDKKKWENEEKKTVVLAFAVDKEGKSVNYSPTEKPDKIANIIENATGGSGDDEITGNSADNVLKGEGGSDKLYGNYGDDILDGGSGADSMFGGQGNDIYYVDNFNDTVTENANEDNDTVNSSITYALSDNVENLTLTDGSAINGTGNSLDNLITGNNSDNNLSGADGNDTLYGADGNDKLFGGAGSDTLDGGNGNDTTSYLTSTTGVTVNLSTGLATGGDASGDVLKSIEYLEGSEFRDTLTGDSQNNRLWGLGGDDTLDGGLGDDSMFGGQGNDQYYMGSINDKITEYSNEGTDSVFSSVTFTLSDYLENLTLTGNSVINGTGNSLDNTITGNDSDNYLYGLDGNDTLISGGGTDYLDGGLGADSMFGGQGNDNYYVDNINDITTELSSEGNDNVFSSVTYTLAANLENLTLTGNSVIDGTGNSLDNAITGNNANNTLDGKAGSDTLYGNAGNDTILGDDSDDKLIGGVGADVLNGGNGIDTASYFTATTGVTASLSASQNNTGDALGDVYQSIENLSGSEFGDSLFGDNQNNTLIGLGGDDFLDGFGGNDTLIGGKDNDTYKLYSIGDLITEYANEGTDIVNAAISYTLGGNIENLNLLEGTAAVDGTGNELNNIINGNSAKNTLNGGAGDDSLFGFAGGDTLIGGDGSDLIVGAHGNDILTGDNGNDSFVYNAITDAGDRITDFTLSSDKLIFTDLLKSLGYQGSNAITDGILGFRQASPNLAVIQIDPDGLANNQFRATPFILLDNVSVAALNNSNSFVL